MGSQITPFSRGGAVLLDTLTTPTSSDLKTVNENYFANIGAFNYDAILIVVDGKETSSNGALASISQIVATQNLILPQDENTSKYIYTMFGGNSNYRTITINGKTNWGVNRIQIKGLYSSTIKIYGINF